jgi:peptidoglycan-associated lipoprotein
VTLKTILPAFAAALMLAACSGSSDSTTSGSASTNGAGNGTGGAGSRYARPGSEEDLVANVGDRVFFDTDKATISGSSAQAANNSATLDKQANWLKQYPQNAVLVAGNCDERGTTEYNLALGQRRAQAAQAYLIAKGVAQSRITTVSYGKERPTALGSTADAWAQNRNAITSVK